jgi:hypothetical protein
VGVRERFARIGVSARIANQIARAKAVIILSSRRLLAAVSKLSVVFVTRQALRRRCTAQWIQKRLMEALDDHRFFCPPAVAIGPIAANLNVFKDIPTNAAN